MKNLQLKSVDGMSCLTKVVKSNKIKGMSVPENKYETWECGLYLLKVSNWAMLFRQAKHWKDEIVGR